jgi:hypothetical protein
MAVSLGAHTFGCVYNGPPPVPLAEPRVAVVEVFGLHGVGEIEGGRTNRMIPIFGTYRSLSYTTLALLYAAIQTDDAQKGGTVATLTVDGVSFGNCKFRGVNVDQSEVFLNKVNNSYVARNVLLLFRQLDA